MVGVGVIDVDVDRRDLGRAKFKEIRGQLIGWTRISVVGGARTAAGFCLLTGGSAVRAAFPEKNVAQQGGYPQATDRGGDACGDCRA